ncbi:hypothetical protein L596_010432 [Steinernema carpocapsae]|uniref:Major facilitator superfamily (MFS) profile domain-containing protein n=1 Tax=Steinernema carpocapsae TaxID=34508 RepID=A0A4V6A6X8_STECR|nr:hypothetical protein L596_010432 [Steinernema carpocapsae]
MLVTLLSACCVCLHAACRHGRSYRAAMEVEDALLEKEKIHKETFVGPDDVLDELGAKNAYIIYIFMAMGFAWFVAAPHTMIGAFINESDDSHCYYNSTDCFPTISIKSEFELHGDLSSMPAASVSAGIIGDMFGGFILSAISDRFGRKLTVCLACISIGTLGTLSAFSPNIYVFISMKFLQGAFFSGLTLVNWVLSYESIPHSIRSYSSIVFGAMWVLGYCALSPIAYYVHDWRWMTAVTSIPSAVAGIIYYLTIPESFHFLASKRDLSKVKKWMKTTESFGKQKLTITAEQLLDDMAITHPQDDDEDKNGPSFIDGVKELLSNRTLMVNLSVMAYLWVCNAFVYYALSLFSTALAGNRYVNYVLIGLVELPAYIIMPYLLDTFGRRKVVCICHATIGISLLAVMFLPSDSVYLKLTLWLIAKGAVSASFNSIFIYSSEVFPTTYRNFCIGLCSITSKFMNIFAPHVGALDAIDPRIPLLFYGFLGITSSLLTLMLPETLNRPLPSTLSDVQEN